ncbi:response regulator [Patescibacteria group bacterium]|nr:response regulator [Patescibacteria group bacterium]
MVKLGAIPKKYFKILHFEDSHKITKIYREAFIKAGFGYKKFTYPPVNLIKIVRKEKPDYIIMDTSMPKMDGFAASKMLKEYDDTKHIPILGLSDIDNSVGIRWALNLGLDDYWQHKDHTPQEIVKKIISTLQPTLLRKYDQGIAKKTVVSAPFVLSMRIYLRYKKVIIRLIVFLVLITGPLILLFGNYFGTRVNEYLITSPINFGVTIRPATFYWNYKGEEYSISENFYKEVYVKYKNHPAKFYNYGTKISKYYEQFINNIVLEGDNSITEIVKLLKEEGNNKQLNSDEIVELAVAFVQSIPYDVEKREAILKAPAYYFAEQDRIILSQVESSWPKFPYETLYEQKGVCTDKTFLAIAILQQLDYGIALIDLGEHTAPGIKCPEDYSTFSTGYCFIEVTSPGYLIGELPSSIDNFEQPLEKSASSLISKPWDIESEDSLYQEIFIYEVSKGKEYNEIINNMPALSAMKEIERECDAKNKLLHDLMNKIEVLKQEETDLKIVLDEYYNTFLSTGNIEVFYQYEDILHQDQQLKENIEEIDNQAEEIISELYEHIEEYKTIREQL